MSKALCYYAFEALYTHHYPEIPSVTLSEFFSLSGESSSSLPSSAPLFVTWTKNGDLRGCIGTFQKLPIKSGISQFSLTSALQDSRFSPISKSELSSLKVGVTLLDNFIEINEWDDWSVGLNGLRVEIEHRGHFSGTFLPSVAEDEEWDKETTLYYLLKKSSYDGVRKGKEVDFYKRGLQEGWLKLTRYDGLKAEATWKEFLSKRSEE
jgi:uncharacterized protein (TIGR00296 family)